jgi:hypothetical protein
LLPSQPWCDACAGAFLAGAWQSRVDRGQMTSAAKVLKRLQWDAKEPQYVQAILQKLEGP